MYSIVGSGFGLYGYLPALVRLDKNNHIVLPQKYREKILSRKELKGFDRDILWASSSEEALKKTTDLIMAVPPSAQYSIVKKIVKESNIETINLEKPIAPSAELSEDLLDFLDFHEIKYVIGYSFFYLNLQDKFDYLIAREEDIYWNWEFMAHHFSMNLDNWKRYHDVGGGVLRFYGIHMIALLSALGYDNVAHSILTQDNINEPHLWKASFSGAGIPLCNISLNCKSKNNIFDVSNDSLGTVISSRDPFDLITEDVKDLDNRVPILRKIIDKSSYRQYKLKSLYRDINKLWKKVEETTKIMKTC